MKKSLYLVLKSGAKSFALFEDLKASGFNATVISTESLRRAVEYYPEENHFFSLRHLENRDLKESMFVIFIVSPERLEILKDKIRTYTNNFQDIKGFMYSFDVLDYEGTV